MSIPIRDEIDLERQIETEHRTLQASVRRRRQRCQTQKGAPAGAPHSLKPTILRQKNTLTPARTSWVENSASIEPTPTPANVTSKLGSSDWMYR